MARRIKQTDIQRQLIEDQRNENAKRRQLRERKAIEGIRRSHTNHRRRSEPSADSTRESVRKLSEAETDTLMPAVQLTMTKNKKVEVKLEEILAAKCAAKINQALEKHSLTNIVESLIKIFVLIIHFSVSS
jgi:hypothetical protein